MKKINTLFLLCSIFIIFDLSAALSLIGAGTPLNPYQINTAAELKSVHDEINGTNSTGGYVNACYKLNANIDM